MASALALAHIEGERRLRETTKQGLTRIWRGLPGLDRSNLDQWLSEALPLVLAAQRSSATLTQAYLARAIERPPVGIDPTTVIGAAVRNGTPPAEVYTRPFIAVWSELSAGNTWQDAANHGLERATSSAGMDIQLTMRATLRAVAEAYG